MAKPDINDAVERKDEHHIERHNYILNFKKSNKIDLLFIGDSLTRRWMEVPQIWDYYFAGYNAANFGVGSDTIQNVKWRLLNGEIDGIKPKIVVLLIGTNNLPEYSGEEVCEGIAGLVDIIREKLPESKIILMGLLPRDPDNQCDDYMKKIKMANNGLIGMSKRHNLVFFDIGDEFIGAGNKVNRDLLPDGLHMNELGYKIWGEKIKPLIDNIWNK